MFEVIRWASVALCLVATAGNIFALIYELRCSHRLSEMRNKYLEEYLKLVEYERSLTNSEE